MGRRWTLRFLTASILVAATPVTAAADWYLTPFAAMKFGGSTTLIDQDLVAGGIGAVSARKWVWGGTATWLGTGVLGLEADLAWIPGYFEGDREEVLASRVTTLTGNVVFAAPLGLTRDSLRPYVSGGLGLMRASAQPPGLEYTRNLSALNVGGGVIGMLSARTGVRWDLRYQRGIGSAEGGSTAMGGPARLSFWRASMGFVIRH